MISRHIVAEILQILYFFVENSDSFCGYLCVKEAYFLGEIPTIFVNDFKKLL